MARNLAQQRREAEENDGAKKDVGSTALEVGPGSKVKKHCKAPGRMRVKVSYEYADGPEQQRAISILANLLFRTGSESQTSASQDP